METAITACDWNSALLLIFSPNVEPLVYYSHLLTLIVSVLLGAYILYNNRHSLVNWVLAFIMLMFSLWVYFDLILWASPSPEDVMFFWSSIVPIEMLIYAGCLYLVYLFANQQKDISLGKKILIALFFIPIVLFTHTSYNVLGLSPDCDVGAIEGPLIQYMYVVEVLFIIWAAFIVAHGFYSLRKKEERLQLLLIGLGTIIFLLIFTAGNITLIFSLPPEWEQYKLFGMPVFAAFISYCIVRFRAFNAQAITAEILVTGLGIATISLLFLRSQDNMRIVAGLTFILVCILGYILVRGVRREIQLREQTEKLANELAVTNERQEVLIHFIGHEVKASLTKDSGVFASLSEGDLGPLSDPVKQFVDHALAETRSGVDAVANILKASNLKKGTVTYVKEPFDMKAVVAAAVEKAKSAAEQKGLTLTFAADESQQYQVNGDKTQLNDHVLRNLIDNAVNYTPSGSINVSLKKENGKVIFAVKDTGVGITDEDKKLLFTEGGHGKESQKVNVHSTGYGLFIAKQITEAHGGIIRAESEGSGKGSTFIVELPA